MRTRLWVALLISVLVGMVVAAAGRAQPTDALDPSLRLAFISNRDGNEDVFVMAWTGEGAPVNLTRHPARDWHASWSPDGTRIAFNSDRDGTDSIYIMSQYGENPRPLLPPDAFDDADPAWSPTGEWIAFSSNRDGLSRELYLASPDGDTVQRLTNNGLLNGGPAWAPDGQSLVYWQRQRNGELHLFSLRLDSSQPMRLSNTGPTNGAAAFAPDGSGILFDSNREADFTWSLYRMGTAGELPTRLTDAAGNTGRGAYSPDGTYITYTGDGGDSDELYLMRADGTNVEQLTENSISDHSAVWQPVAATDVEALPQPTPTTPATAEAVATTAADQTAALGQSAYNVEVRPVVLAGLLQDYGFLAWHDAGYTGANARVGVIDLGFGGLQALTARTGASVMLPPDADLGAYDADVNDHGSDVLEVVHTVAPGALPFACRYDGSLATLQACADFMRTEGVHIINHSAGLPVLPNDGTNVWATTVERIQQEANVFWVNSAGNFHNGYLDRAFQDTDANGEHDFDIAGNTVQGALRFDTPEGYQGNLLLAWADVQPLDVPRATPDADGNTPPPPSVFDFDLVVDDGSGRPLTSARRQTEANDGLFERLFVQTDGPFEVRVINNGPDVGSQVVRMLFFAEYLVVPDASPTNSILAPADARTVFTVGAVQGVGDALAAYSSRGLLGTEDTYTKPDLAAPGEFILGDNDVFAGTSAASPVIAGAAALLWDYDSSLRSSDRMRNYLEDQVRDMDSVNYGRGLFVMPSAPNALRVVGTDAVPARLVFPQPPQAEAPVELVTAQCQTGIPTRFEVGMDGVVIFNLGLAMRSGPDTTYQQLTDSRGLQLGDGFEVIGGPACNGGLTWWEIELFDSSTGWVAEGDFEYYWLTPLNLTSAQLPDFEGAPCESGAEVRLTVGERAEVVSTPAGGLTIWRDSDAGRVLGGMEVGTQLYVLGGPNCVDGINRWYVRVLEGSFAGNEGWASEARARDRWMQPLDSDRDNSGQIGQ